MIKTLHRFFYAWIFLTKFPAPPLPKATKEDWGRIAPYFVLIGFILGFILYIFAKLFIYFKLPILFSGLLVLLISYLITGCLHLDGLMDTFDGISCQDKDRKVEAMKDSRIGAFGAIAGIFVILFKLICLCTILLNKMYFVILLAPAISRLITVYSFTYLSQNQKSGVSSSLLLSGIKKPQDFLVNVLSFVIIFLVTVFFLLICNQGRINPAPTLYISVILFPLVCFFVCLFWSHWLDNHFKGHTGDTFGALIELSEVTVLSLAVILKDYF